MSKKQKEEQIMRDLGIDFVTTTLPGQWPRHLLKTCQQIESFKKITLSTFYARDPPISSFQFLWRKETTDRVREIVAIAATLIKDKVVEMEVRLRLEHLILSHLIHQDINCKYCSKRLWRSAVEVVVEFPDCIAKILDIRRGERQLCQCSPRVSKSAQNSTIFTSRADETISFDSFQSCSEMKIANRRPDRIVGFQETNDFSRRLNEYNLTISRSQYQVGPETLRETVESTVLSHGGNSLLFPFLVIEAKSRNGDSFDACNRQAALPILKMLKIQEDLQMKSQMTLEYGGPLVWYIAYRGEDWRLSMCYISKMSDKSSYEIVSLWSGKLNDEDGALQLLLIIDYIFDWARDIYMPSMKRQLGILANPTEERDHAHDDRFTIADTDSDVFSLAGEKQRGTEACADIENPAEVTPDEEPSLIGWATQDSSFGVFRPACVVESLFRCLCVTKANIDALFSAVPKSQSAKKLAIRVENVLNANSVLISEDVLRRMEEIWTNRARPRQCQDALETCFFATVIYHAEVAANWGLKVSIFCIAFDEEGLNILRQYSKRKSTPVAIRSARRFGKDNAETLLSVLKRQSIHQNLLSAIGSKKQKLQIVAGTPSSNTCPIFKFVDITDREWSDNTAHTVIEPVYDWCKRTPEEPMEPYLRFSQQLTTVASHFPGSEPTQDEEYMLVARYIDGHLKSTLHLCLYTVPGFRGPPTTELLRDALQKAVENDIVYLISDDPNSWKDVCKRRWTENSHHSKKIREAARLWRDEMQERLASSPPVIRSALEREPKCAESKHLLRNGRSLSPYPPLRITPPSSSYASPLSKMKGFLKRHFEDTDKNEVLRHTKSVKTTPDAPDY